MVRGINHRNIFEEEADYFRFLEVLREVKGIKGFKIFAYCLMTNHFHIFLKENEPGDISQIMHRLLTKYVGWFNRKYECSGSLVGNRYKSEPVEEDRYFVTLLRYIHQNPLRSGATGRIEDYRWSSYREYYRDHINDGGLQGGTDCACALTDTDSVMDRFSPDKTMARAMFVELHKYLVTDDFSMGDNKKPTDEQVRRRIIGLLNGREPHSIGEMSKENRNKVLRYLHNEERVPVKQLERITGISRGVITRAIQR